MMTRRAVPRLLAAGVALVLVLLPAAPAAGQLPELDDLPLPDVGAVGALLDPLEELVEQLVAPIDELLTDVPLDNAVRLTGQDAVGAAIALSQATFPSANLVMLARDDIFPDTLSSVAAQGIAGAPLLVTPTTQLEDRVVAELRRLGASRVLVLGNELAVDPAVEQELEDLGFDTVRAGGPTRIETAVEVTRNVAPDTATALLLRAYPDPGGDQAQAYADALAVGPLGSQKEWPVLLTTTDTLHPATAEFLASSAVNNVVIIGGTAAVSEQVASTVAEMGIAVDRIAGPNRFATAIAIAGVMGYDNAADPSRQILSEASETALPLWSAGFAAASHGAVFDAPVLLADGAFLPSETLNFIADGILENALRLSNQPLLCNSFVNLVACETMALLMLGSLNAANDLTDGALAEALGPLFELLLEIVQQLTTDQDGVLLLLLDALAGLLGASEGEDSAAVLASQPEPLASSIAAFTGADGTPRSRTAQSLLIASVERLSAALGGRTIDSSDPAQAAALAEILDGIAELLDERLTDLPLATMDDLLGAVDGLLAEMTDLVEVTVVGDLVEELAPDATGEVDALVDTVASLLAVGGDPDVLVERYGPSAAPLADRVRTLQSR